MAPVLFYFVAAFAIFAVTEQSHNSLRELEEVLKNLAVQTAPEKRVRNYQNVPPYPALEIQPERGDSYESPDVFYKMKDERIQQQLENDLQQALRYESNRICRATGRCGCSRGRCGRRPHRTGDRTVDDIEELIRELDNDLNNEKNNDFRSDADRRQKYERRKEEYGEKRQEFNDDRRERQGDRRQEQDDTRQDYDDRRQRLDVRRPRKDDRRQRHDDTRQRNDDRKQEDRRQRQEDRRQRQEDRRQRQEDRRQRWDDRWQEQDNSRHDDNDRRQRQDEQRQRQDDRRQRQDDQRQRPEDRRQRHEDIRQRQEDKRQRWDDRWQEQDDRRQRQDDRRQRPEDRRQRHEDRRQRHEDVRQRWDDRRQKQGDLRDDNDNRQWENNDNVDQNIKLTSKNYKNGDFDIVVLEVGSNELQNRADNVKVIGKKEQRPDILSLEDFVRYYDNIKKEVLNAMLKYIKGRGDGSYLSQLLPYQRKQIEYLKNMQNKSPLDDNALKNKMVQLLFGSLSNIKLLPHSKDGQTIYIPQRVHSAIPVYNRNDTLRANKKLFPLTLHQKQRQRHLSPINIILNHSWRRNNGVIPNYGLPFNLQVQGLGQAI